MEQKEDKQKQKVMVIIRILAGVCFFFIGLW